MKIFLVAVFSLILGHSSLIAQDYSFDNGHTFISFSVERFASADVQGRFNDFAGSLSYDSTQQMISAAEISIEVNSIDTNHEIRDGHLKSPIWLDAAAHPQIHFKAKTIQKTKEGYLAKGALTIHGVTKEIELPFKMFGPAIDPTKQTTIGIATTIIIDRQDYGISFSKLMDNGKLFIGNEVAIQINALAQMNKS